MTSRRRIGERKARGVDANRIGERSAAQLVELDACGLQRELGRGHARRDEHEGVAAQPCLERDRGLLGGVLGGVRDEDAVPGRGCRGGDAAQDLLEDCQTLQRVRDSLRGKGCTGRNFRGGKSVLTKTCGAPRTGLRPKR